MREELLHSLDTLLHRIIKRRATCTRNGLSLTRPWVLLRLLPPPPPRLDCDREGENICFEVMDSVLPKMNRGAGRTVHRARFSAVSSPEIHHAMDNLTVPNENEARRGKTNLSLLISPTRAARLGFPS